MREILFRGKTSDGNWITGNYIHAPGNEFKHNICSPDSPYDWYEVKPETVGQYIGVTDANNVRIFEGDIVRETSEGPYIYVVVYRNSSFCVIALTDYRPGKDYYGSIDDSEFGISVDEWYEVVGNIYDNPELVEI